MNQWGAAWVRCWNVMKCDPRQLLHELLCLLIVYEVLSKAGNEMSPLAFYSCPFPQRILTYQQCGSESKSKCLTSPWKGHLSIFTLSHFPCFPQADSDGSWSWSWTCWRLRETATCFSKSTCSLKVGLHTCIKSGWEKTSAPRSNKIRACRRAGKQGWLSFLHPCIFQLQL